MYFILINYKLDQTEDIDDRKAIRSRIQELRAIERGNIIFKNIYLNKFN